MSVQPVLRGARGRAALVLAAYLAAPPIGAAYLAAQARPGPTPDWAALLAPGQAVADAARELDAAAEPLPQPLLAEAALVASGVEGGRIPEYRARLESLLAELAEELGRGSGRETGADPAALGEAVLVFLHERLFKAYEADATTLDLVLDKGRYNCVSSALLYLIAARGLGLEVRGVKTRDHAFCVLRAGGREIDVETTNRYGFDPGNKKEFRDSFGRVTGYAYSPPGKYARREPVGDRSFAGLVLVNRAGLLERAGRYREALVLGAELAVLAPGAESRAFLLDRVNNVAADLTRRRDYAGAGALAKAARAALGEEPRLAELSAAAAYNGVAALASAGRWEEALEAAAALLDGEVPPGALPREELGALVEGCVGNLVAARVNARDFDGARALLAERAGLLAGAAGPQAEASLRRRIGEAELGVAVETLGFAEGLAAADRALAAGYASRQRWEEALAYLYGNEANRLARDGDLLGAAATAERGAAAIGRGSGLAAPLARFAGELRRSFAAKAHNEFARLYNDGRYREALESIEAAAALLPGDATLAADLKAAREAAR